MAGIICGSDKVDAAVNTHDIADFAEVCFRDLIADRDMKIELSVPIDKLCRPETVHCAVKVLFHAILVEGEFQPSGERVHGETFPVQGIVPVPYKVELRLPEVRADPFSLIFEDILLIFRCRLSLFAFSEQSDTASLASQI